MMEEESSILKEFRSNSEKKDDESSESGKRDDKILIYVFTGKEGESKIDDFEDEVE